jgi:hypothetical protein
MVGRYLSAHPGQWHGDRNLTLGVFGPPITRIGRWAKQPLEKLRLFLPHGNV